MNSEDVKAPGEIFNYAGYLLELNQGRAQKTAYIDDAGTLSYGDLANDVRRVAGALLAAGLRREERVLLLMHDCNDWPVAFLGAMYAGIVPVAVNTLLPADDYRYMLQHSRARAALVSSALLPVLREAMQSGNHEVESVIVSRPDGDLAASETAFDNFMQQAQALDQAVATSPDDPGFWLYSSGSTGKPKGTVHTHANPYWTSELYGKGVLGITEVDVCFSAAKLFFAYGLGNALTFPLCVGASSVLLGGRPTPDVIFQRLIDHQPTLFFGAPTGYVAMLAYADKPAREQLALRLAVSAGEALPADLAQRFSDQFGVDVIDGIGSTEMLHIYISNRPGAVRLGSSGYPVPGYDIELRSDDGLAVAAGDIGDLYVRGPSAALMYWNNRDKSRETFQGEWTKSGDKYVLNDDGSFTCSGRSDDMLRVSGMYVSPFEVEATLVEHPAVLESAVIGKTDADGLVKTKAFVVLAEDQQASAEDLQAFVKDRLAPHKYPRYIEFVDELPKTATGKIQRFRLREREAAAST
ncbi:MAG: benzoate-CoA ligase family protein [Gammaproteobacteria bacterium]|nr:benzoate-CoA ligase family protein [Gammaproteobacteria bacterium]MDH3858142.1 benzoate-CoA ligase family protein [Gammaproteobacteria bacterium]